MTITELTVKMIDKAAGNLHDICHFLKVHAYAKMIGEMEKLDDKTQFILEVAAVVHDISCPLCREKYGSTNGKYQETEGAPLVEAFLRDTGMSPTRIQRVQYLVGHHHTFADIDGADYQILIEADYIANASENGYGAENILNFVRRYFKTNAGRRLIGSVFGL